MRAALLEQGGTPLRVVDDIEITPPGPGQVLVEVAACGICHSDLTMIDGQGSLAPVVLGHEAAGRVVEIGQGVTSVRPGDHVMLTPLPSCGRCYYCVRGQPTICVQAISLFTGLLPDGTSPLSRHGELVYRGLGVGGFGQYALVVENGAVPIPPDVPLDLACLCGCALQTGVGAVLNTAKVEPGATVFVAGLGGVGISVVQGARLAGAARIIVSDPVGARRDAAANLGATDVLDPTQDDVVARSRELTGGIGVDYAFDAAGSGPLVETCIAATRNGGTTVMVGAPPVDHEVRITPAVAFLTVEKRLMGSLLGSAHGHREIPRLLAWWRQGRLDLEAMVSNRIGLDEINDGLEDLRRSQGIRTVVRVGG
ncbi:MAG: Zn-dependent alcohol dehydrogenase [Acidimicrobiales bacterium]|jgi:Zn-dependent alcohol dehydrogenase|nr:Zn-dependent alcohol dehydrogenase [Acidimicrobiales bacterium]